MERKLSKFAVDSQVTTGGKIKKWATGENNVLSVSTVYSITEHANGITYYTNESRSYNEEELIDPNHAKKIALKFLAERMIIIAEQGEPCQQE